MNVVIVEDDFTLARLEAFVLEERHEVTLVTTNFRALLTPEPWADIDVAVIDLMLPDLPGEDIVTYLASQHPKIRRVVCTARPIYELGELINLADQVLLKPFSIESFQRAVEWTA